MKFNYIPSTSRIMVCLEKHGDIYIDVSTEEKEINALIAIFSERKKEGYYGFYIKKSLECQVIPTTEEIEKEERPVIKNSLRQLRDSLIRYKKDKLEWQNNMEWLKKGIEERSLQHLRRFMASRSDHEYEEIQIHDVGSYEVL